MALRDQPYFPFYVDDWLTDEKLIECSAESQGVCLRIMCYMHKSQKYGTILLKQKDKQSDQQVKNFAIKLGRRMPFSVDVIESSINELVSEDVLQIDGDILSQKRMVKDNEISLKRAKAGSRGGFATAKKIANKPANNVANTVIVNEYVSSSVSSNTSETSNNGKSSLVHREEIEINPDHRECSDLLKKRILETRQAKIEEKRMLSWDDEVRKMIKYDNRSIEDIKSLIDECHDMEPQKGGFTWRNNILSMKKLRYHWNEGNIAIGMNSKSKEKKSGFVKSKTEYDEPVRKVPILTFD